MACEKRVCVVNASPDAFCTNLSRHSNMFKGLPGNERPAITLFKNLRVIPPLIPLWIEPLLSFIIILYCEVPYLPELLRSMVSLKLSPFRTQRDFFISMCGHISQKVGLTTIY